MADPAPPPPPAPGGLPCPECGFDNPVNSVYCQDCGTRLPVAPPSYLQPNVPPPIAEATPASDQKAPSRSKKPRIIVSGQSRPAAGRFIGVTVRTIIYAALLAGIIQMFRAPRDLPAPTPAIDASTIEEVRARFMENAQRGVPVDAPWARINAYLGGAIVPAEGGVSSFVRALVTYRPEGFALVTEKNLAKRLPVYTTIDYSVVTRSNGLSLVPTGGAIGRVPFPRWAARLLPLIGGDISPALRFELDLLKDAKGIQSTPTSARIDFAPAQP